MKTEEEKLLKMFNSQPIFEDKRTINCQKIGGYYTGNSVSSMAINIIFEKPLGLSKKDILEMCRLSLSDDLYKQNLYKENLYKKFYLPPKNEYSTTDFKLNDLISNHLPTIKGKKVIYENVVYESWFIYD